MAWVTFASTDVETYGRAILEYDDSSTGNARSCQFRFELNSGSTIYIYFDNVTIDGTVVTSSVLVSGSTTIWSGSLASGSRSFSFSCPWYSGTKTYSGSGTIPAPESYSKPSGLSFSSVSAGSDYVTGTVSVSSWGIGVGSNTLGLFLSNSSSQQNITKYDLRWTKDTSVTITLDNNTSLGAPQPALIIPNKRYYVYGYASNGGSYRGASDGSVYTSASSMGEIVTLPEKANMWVVSKTGTSAVIGYTISASGGAYGQVLKYRLGSSGSWITVTTVSGTSEATGTFTVTGLTAGNTYTLNSTVSTTAGTVTNSSITFVSMSTSKFYMSSENMFVPVKGGATKVSLLYGSVNNRAVFIKKLYAPKLVSSSYVAKQIF